MRPRDSGIGVASFPQRDRVGRGAAAAEALEKLKAGGVAGDKALGKRASGPSPRDASGLDGLHGRDAGPGARAGARTGTGRVLESGLVRRVDAQPGGGHPVAGRRPGSSPPRRFAGTVVAVAPGRRCDGARGGTGLRGGGASEPVAREVDGGDSRVAAERARVAPRVRELEVVVDASGRPVALRVQPHDEPGGRARRCGRMRKGIREGNDPEHRGDHGNPCEAPGCEAFKSVHSGQPTRAADRCRTPFPHPPISCKIVKSSKEVFHSVAYSGYSVLVPRRPRIFEQGCMYHLTPKGNDGRRIFGRRHRFDLVHRLDAVARSYGLVILGYCLMDNHLHFVIVVRDSRVSDAMRSPRRVRALGKPASRAARASLREPLPLRAASCSDRHLIAALNASTSTR